MKLIHVASALIALVAGAFALFAAKGSRVHRLSGLIFTVSMLIMTSSAFIMAVFFFPNRLNVTAASLTFYLVATAFLALRPLANVRGLTVGLMFGGAAVGLYGYIVGVQTAATDVATSGSVFVFGSVAWLSAFGDARLLRTGNLQGAKRLLRHLWRMSTAMLIATMSLFIGQPDFFPEPLRHDVGLRSIPLFVVLAVMAYWLARLGLKRRRGLPTHLRSTQSASR